jgi:hypothetical protein
MSAFTKQRRQRIIDGYLAESGENVFVPSRFIDWLSGQPQHEAYPAFFSVSDEEAARAYRIEMARRFVQGLRITVSEQTVEGTDRKVSVRMVEAPRYLSPVSNRHEGGGYVPYDPESPEDVAELRRQATVGFQSWYRRHESALTRGEQELATKLFAALEKVTESA